MDTVVVYVLPSGTIIEVERHIGVVEPIKGEVSHEQICEQVVAIVVESYIPKLLSCSSDYLLTLVVE